MAEALIKAGVRCVVAAGWAIDDEAAPYLRRRSTRGSWAVRGSSTRLPRLASAARELGGNTWAAYQCYGDPDWQYRRGTGDAQRPSPPPPSEELAGIPSVFALVLTLKTLAVKSEFQNADTAEQAARLEYLEHSAERLWRNNGEVAEAFGNAWAKAGNFDKSHCVVRTRARLARWHGVTCSHRAARQFEGPTCVRGGDGAERQATDAAQQKARREIAEAMALMDTLLSVGATVERESLYGSAYKRLALIEAAAGREDEEIEAISKMKDHYNAAEQIARSARGECQRVNLYYPVMNRIAAQLALEGGAGRASARTPKRSPLFNGPWRLRQSISGRLSARPS